MEPIRAEIEAVYAVLVGNFNPAIFQPAWLGRHGFASDTEVETAAIEIIRPEIASYTLGPFKLVIEPQRFQIETLQPDQGFRMKDLMASIFGILKETPVRQMGINTAWHFRMSSEERWHAVGHRLVPKDLWKDTVVDPGTLSVSVQGRRPNGSSKYVVLKVEPSTQVRPGVFLQTNEHFETHDEQATQMVATLLATWDESLAYARRATQELLTRCLAE